MTSGAVLPRGSLFALLAALAIAAALIWANGRVAHAQVPVGEPPPITNALPKDQAVDVLFDHVGHDRTGFDHYDLRYIRSDATDKADGQWTVLDAIRSYTVGGLTNGVMYDFQVRTDYHHGSSVWSPTISATPQVGIAVEWEPGSVTGREDSGTATLRVRATTVRDEQLHTTFPNFSVEVNTADRTATAPADYTALADHELTFARSDFTAIDVGGETRYRAVKDVVISIIDDSDVELQESFTATLAYADDSPPGYLQSISRFTPQGRITVNIASDETASITSVSPNDGAVSLEWDELRVKEVPNFRHYIARYIRSDATDKSESRWTYPPQRSTTRTMEVSGLTNGVEYEFQVAAVYQGGSGDWSASATGTPQTGVFVKWTASVFGGREDSGTATLTVSAITVEDEAPHSSMPDFSVWVNTTDGDGGGGISPAIAPDDYVQLSNHVVTFSASDFERYEHFPATGSLPAEYRYRAQKEVTITLVDDQDTGFEQFKAELSWPDGPRPAYLDRILGIESFTFVTIVSSGEVANLSATPRDQRAMLYWIESPGGVGWQIRYIRSDASDKSDPGAWMSPGSHRPLTVVSGLTNGVSYDFEVRSVVGGAPGPWFQVSATPRVDVDVEWENASFTGREDTGTATLRVVATTARDEAPDSTFPNFSVKVNTADDTAMAPADYTAISDHEITFSRSDFTRVQVNGQWRYRAVKDVAVTLVDDDDVELAETFTARLAYGSRPGEYLDGINTAAATVNLVSDETPYFTSISPKNGAVDLVWSVAGLSRSLNFLLNSYEVRYILSGAANKADDSAWSHRNVISHRIHLDGLTNGMSYVIQVRSVYRGGVVGDWSKPVTATPRAMPVAPGAPRITGVTAVDGGATVAWTPPVNDGGTRVLKSRMRYIRSDATDKADANWTEKTLVGSNVRYTLRGLSGALSYDFQIQAENRVGRGPWSATMTGTPLVKIDVEWYSASASLRENKGRADLWVWATTVRKDPFPAEFPNFSVTVNTADGAGASPAVAPDDYTALVNHTVTFSAADFTPTQQDPTLYRASKRVRIAIENDDEFELPETFTAALAYAATPRPVHLDEINQATATVEIVSLDPLPFTLEERYERIDLLGTDVLQGLGVEWRYIRSNAVDKSDANWMLVTTGDFLPGLTNWVQYDFQVRVTHRILGGGRWSETVTATPSEALNNSDTPRVLALAWDRSAFVYWEAPGDLAGKTLEGFDVRYVRSAVLGRPDVEWTVRRVPDQVLGDLGYVPRRHQGIYGLTNGTQYSVQVRAVYASAAPSPWSDVRTFRPQVKFNVDWDEDGFHVNTETNTVTLRVALETSRNEAPHESFHVAYQVKHRLANEGVFLSDEQLHFRSSDFQPVGAGVGTRFRAVKEITIPVDASLTGDFRVEMEYVFPVLDNNAERGGFTQRISDLYGRPNIYAGNVSNRFAWVRVSGESEALRVRDLELTPLDNSMRVTWRAPEETGGADITGYDVQYKRNSNESWTDYAGNISLLGMNGESRWAAEISDSDMLVQDGNFRPQYDFRVRSKTATDPGPWSGSVHGRLHTRIEFVPYFDNPVMVDEDGGTARLGITVRYLIADRVNAGDSTGRLEWNHPIFWEGGGRPGDNPRLVFRYEEGSATGSRNLTREKCEEVEDCDYIARQAGRDEDYSRLGSVTQARFVQSADGLYMQFRTPFFTPIIIDDEHWEPDETFTGTFVRRQLDHIRDPAYYDFTGQTVVIVDNDESEIRPLNLAASPGAGQMGLSWDPPDKVKVSWLSEIEYDVRYIQDGATPAEKAVASNWTDVADCRSPNKATACRYTDTAGSSTDGVTITGLTNWETYHFQVRSVVDGEQSDWVEVKAYPYIDLTLQWVPSFDGPAEFDEGESGARWGVQVTTRGASEAFGSGFPSFVVSASTIDGTATAPEDFAALDGEEITFQLSDFQGVVIGSLTRQQATKYFDFTIVDDPLAEPDEEFQATLDYVDEENVPRPGYLKTYERGLSLPVTITDNDRVPGPPVITSAAGDHQAVNVSWTAPTDTGTSPVSNYQVRYIDGDATDKSDGQWTGPTGVGTATSHTQTGLTNGGEYEFQVRAVSAAGDGPWSLPVRGTPAPPVLTLRLAPSSILESDDPDTTADENVTVVTAHLDQAASVDLTVTVTAPTSSRYTLSTNAILTIAAGDLASTGVVSLTAVDDEVDAPDETVPVSAITAANNGGVEDPESASLSIKDDEDAPGVTLSLDPETIAEEGGTTTLTATLSGPSSEDTTVTVKESEAFTSSADGVIEIEAGSLAGTLTLTAVDNAVAAASTANTTVLVSATAENEQGVTDPADVSLTITDDEIPPANAPTDLEAAARDEEVVVRWVEPVAGGGPVTGYKVRYILSSATAEDKADDTKWGTADAEELTVYTVDGLITGRQYDFQVLAYNGHGLGPWSSTVTATPWAPAITAVTTGAGEATVTWGVRPADGPAVTGYQVRYMLTSADESDDANWTGPVAAGTGTSYEVAGLSNGQSYDFQVRAVDTGATPDWFSRWSDTAVATPRTTPDAPFSLAAAARDAEVVLNWSPPASDGGSAVTGYQLRYIAEDEDDEDEVAETWTTPIDVGAGTTQTVTTHTVTGLSNGQAYKFEVRAVNAAGAGAWSTTATATPWAPTISMVTAGDTEVTVTWDARPADGPTVSGFQVRY